MATKRDYYEILGIDKKSSAKQIKSAYRKMALKYHPDKNKAANAEEKFKEINEAYQILSDGEKKKTYDQFGHAAFDPTSGMGGNPFSGASRQGQSTWGYSTSGASGGQNPFGNVDFNDPFDIFESFFGGGQRNGFTPRQRYSLTIDFMDAVNGVEKEVKINGKKHKIRIPVGASDGTRVRFDDFDISFNVKTHPRFKRDGYDIFIDQKISFSMAALGGKIEVETLSGQLKLKIRPGTQSHTLIRLRGEGVKHLRGRGQGDLYVRLIVKIPEKLSKEEKKLLEQLVNL